ncbi:hypothetical protein EVAR_82139_1 [Eumeta japonica]|uniref:Uncharacterized protein n=1 Tax=Eumeta variegata TaxID=151549 RepID=A0A4C1U356_EUMVA|nr:hypothetical protein EVAR_82139_1 [Eumeta japonica]
MSQCNRVQAIKCKFESLNNDKDSLICRKNFEPNTRQLFKQNSFTASRYERHDNSTKENWQCDIVNRPQDENKPTTELHATPNDSYLYKNTKKVIIETKKLNLTRQSSDPGKKLHRSHAFRCDRSQKIGNSPKRHSSCNGRTDTSEHPVKMEKPKLSKERLKKLGNLLEDRMKKENFVSSSNHQSDKMDITNDSSESSETVTPVKEEIPQHILDLYAKVLKNKKRVPEPQDNKKDGMTDSGVSSETENLEDNFERNRVNKLKAQFETPKINFENPTNPYELIDENSDTSKIEIQNEGAINIYEKLKDSEGENDLEEVELTNSSEKIEEKDVLNNLQYMETNDLCASSETMKLERKNPHLILTDTLKKALKQPLPNGPPPKKPPRTFVLSNTKTEKKNTLQMLEKLEIALQKQESKKHKPERSKKEMHYLCTEILDITKRSLTINQNKCLGLNCANISSSYMSLPYTRLSAETSICSCNPKNVNAESPEVVESVCQNCHANLHKDTNFRCHLHCKCEIKNSEFYIDKPEHVYDIPFSGDLDENPDDSANDAIGQSEEDSLRTVQRKTANEYGLPKKLEVHSKSLESLSCHEGPLVEDEKIYDTPCEEGTPPSSPEAKKNSRVNFENLLKNFESGKIEISKNHRKPAIEHPKPTIVGSEKKKRKNIFKSTDNIVDFREPKEEVEKAVCTESNFKPSSMKTKQIGIEPRKLQREFSRSQSCLNFIKGDNKQQQDVDKENTEVMNGNDNEELHGVRCHGAQVLVSSRPLGLRSVEAVKCSGKKQTTSYRR